MRLQAIEVTPRQRGKKPIRPIIFFGLRHALVPIEGKSASVSPSRPRPDNLAADESTHACESDCQINFGTISDITVEHQTEAAGLKKRDVYYLTTGVKFGPFPILWRCLARRGRVADPG